MSGVLLQGFNRQRYYVKTPIFSRSACASAGKRTGPKTRERNMNVLLDCADLVSSNHYHINPHINPPYSLPSFFLELIVLFHIVLELVHFTFLLLRLLTLSVLLAILLLSILLMMFVMEQLFHKPLFALQLRF